MLRRVCGMQKGYGKSADEMLELDEAFQYKLGRFTWMQVVSAFNEYTDEKSDIPAPADIIQLIDPPKQKLSEAIYREIRAKQKDSYAFVTDEQKEYVRKYERQELDKAKDY